LSDLKSSKVSSSKAEGANEERELKAVDDSPEEKRRQRREQVRKRVEDILDESLREIGRNYVLPDGRVVAIYYSKIHPRSHNTFLGVDNGVSDDDVLVLLLGDETYPIHLVFPRADALLRYRESFWPVGNNRISPPIYLDDESFVLRRPAHKLVIPLDDRIDAYYELLYPLGRSAIAATPIGRRFVEDDEDIVPRAAGPGVSDPDLVARGIRAHKRTRNVLAAYLKSVGIQPLDPTSSDPPFDLAWWQGEVLYIAEIKSTTKENEEHQLRLGLGQLLRYSHLLRERAAHVRPVLVPELQPSDHEWIQLCDALNIRLASPPDFEGVIGDTVDTEAPVSDPPAHVHP
jgi:hypothetical protein